MSRDELIKSSIDEVIFGSISMIIGMYILHRFSEYIGTSRRMMMLGSVLLIVFVLLIVLVIIPGFRR